MSLTIISRPQKSLYVNEPVQVYDEPYYTSFWVAAHLPCVYRIESNLWPNNRQDLISNFNATYNYAGNAAIDLTTGFYTIYKLGDYITIKSSTLTAYVGTWRVIGFAAPDIPILDMPFGGNAGGVAVKYYNNYSIEVEVYTGFDSDEPNSSVRPMQLRATLKLLPDTNNIATVDVSKIVQADFSPFKADESIAGYPNDRNHWTQFYIRYRERYNTPALDGTPELFEGGWQVDTVGESCNEGQVIINSSFDFGTVTATPEINNFSGLLNAGLTYQVDVSYLIGQLVRFIMRGATTGYEYFYLFRSSNGSFTLEITPQLDEAGLILEVMTPFTSTTVNVTNFDVTQISGCTAILNATNSVLQPRSTYGSNMGKYVLHNNNQLFANKFLHDQLILTYFAGYPFTLDFILSQNAVDTANTNGVDVLLVDADFEVISSITPTGQGLYRASVEIDSDKCLTAVVVPPNVFEHGDFGTFEANADGISLVSGFGDNSGRTSFDSYQGLFSYVLTIPAPIEQLETVVTIIESDPINLVTGGIYEIEFFVRVRGDIALTGIFDGNIQEGSSLSISVQLSQGMTSISLPVTVPSIDPTIDTGWLRVSGLFTATLSNPSIIITATYALGWAIDIERNFIFIDNISMKGPIIYLSESKCIKYIGECSNYATYLKWLNPLGGYTYWLFKGASSTTLEPSEATEIKRNIYGNWDEDFIAADTERDYISGGGNEVITLRSDTLTKEQADLVATIMNSTKVYRYVNNRWETVLVQKGSLAKYSQRDKLVSLSVDVMPTFDILSQEQ